MGRPKTVTEEVKTLNRADRPNRVGINGKRDILNVKGQEAGWHYCWVNEDQVPRYQDGAYEFVTHEVTIGDRKVDAASSIGGKISKAVGNGVTAYLMRVPDEYFKEDMDSIQKEVDASEEAMYAELNSRKPGHYGKVEMDIGSRRRAR